MDREIRYSEDGTLYVRKSMIEDYCFCPLKFYKKWIIQQPPHRVRGTVAMNLGTRFHEFADRFFDYCETVSVDNWYQLIPDEMNDMEKEWCEWFIDMERERLDNAYQWRPEAREIKLVDDERCLESICDRVDRVSKNGVAIIEYKTGRSFYLPSLERQTAFYSLLWESMVGSDYVEQMVVINPREKRVDELEVGREKMEEVVKVVEQLRGDLDNVNNGKDYREVFYPKCSLKKFAFCGMCEVDEAQLWKKSSCDLRKDSKSWNK